MSKVNRLLKNSDCRLFKKVSDARRTRKDKDETGNFSVFSFQIS
jgi:hypothetical protein